MQSSTLVMSSPALDQGSLFSRSHSSPNISGLVPFEYKPATPRQESELPRSASYTGLASLEGQHSGGKGLEEVVISSADVAENVSEDAKALAGKYGKKSNKLTKEERPKLERVGRRKSLVSRPKSWIQKVKGSPERQNQSGSNDTTDNGVPVIPTIPKSIRENKSKSVSESFATFARKSWISSSRSSSPVRVTGKDTEPEKQRAGEVSTTAGPASSISAEPTPAVEQPVPTKLPESPPKPESRRSSAIQKMKARPQSVLMSFTTLASANSSTSSLPRSSMDNKSTPRTSTDKVPPVPKTFSTEKIASLVTEIPRKRDELWSAFRSLDNDYNKFQSKSWSLKTNVVRASLLPFLKNHASHPSYKNLRHEDLERRVTILHKWWSGLLEVLDGRQNQTVSGVDRPVLLEACYSIMIRPEWRVTPSEFTPLSNRSSNASPTRRLPRRKSSGSLDSSASQFLAESVYHNTRNLFTENLLSQAAFVVDKMSLRHAPASLVTFCGKAIAYAFFFVPGIADVLVRVWKLQPEVLRRVSDELHLPRIPNRFETDEVSVAFPEHMKALGWTSPKSMATLLRKNPILSIMAGKINWYGPWTARWCGRDSDLFFIFAKHYYILTEDFVPEGLDLTMKARAPAFILVQAQILTVLDATIHRQPASDPLPITFDDVLAGADASAAALPLPSANSARPMAENRLIMLLRDFLAERISDHESACITFAETFGKMLQASARKTSLFDHSACFVLFDFLEEALNLYIRFHHTHGLQDDFIEWRFWLEVCKKILESKNSMSEIRLFAFIYSTWNVVSNDESRKGVVCFDWLLTEDMFGKFFCHWCPMVRAYYMRLLCWRICRDDGESSDLDVKIFSVVSTRIKLVWSYYLFSKQSAEKALVLPPSTAPCHPAPGRRLLIIRNDNLAPSTNIFLGFDGITTSPGAKTSPSKRHSLAALVQADVDSPPKLTTDPASVAPKKRWSLMGKVIPNNFSFESSPSASPSSSRSTSPTKTLEEARRETARVRRNSSTSRQPNHQRRNSQTPHASPERMKTHSQPPKFYSFKFSLEWAQHFEKPTNLVQNGIANSKEGVGNGRPMMRGGTGLNIGADRRLSPPRLPAPAQGLLTSRLPLGAGNEILSKDPADGDLAGKAERLSQAKYAGRALAEWSLVVGECNTFVDRRKAEGIPGLKWVEIPTLGVEGFRKWGG